MLLATLCFFVPDIEERLREAMPGRGRQKTAEVIEGASNCFFLDPSLPDASKKVHGCGLVGMPPKASGGAPRRWGLHAGGCPAVVVEQAVVH